jgi:hypothetical protein
MLHKRFVEEYVVEYGVPPPHDKLITQVTKWQISDYVRSEDIISIQQSNVCLCGPGYGDSNPKYIYALILDIYYSKK